MPPKSERNEAGTDASEIRKERGRNECLKIRGTQKGTAPFLFRSFYINISRRILNIYTKISFDLYTLQYKSQNIMRNKS